MDKVKSVTPKFDDFVKFAGDSFCVISEQVKAMRKAGFKVDLVSVNEFYRANRPLIASLRGSIHLKVMEYVHHVFEKGTDKQKIEMTKIVIENKRFFDEQEKDFYIEARDIESEDVTAPIRWIE